MSPLQSHFEDFIDSISIIKRYINHLNLPGMEFAEGYVNKNTKRYVINLWVHEHLMIYEHNLFFGIIIK